MKIGIIGSGSFALALSNILCENNHEVLLYSKNESTKEEIGKRKRSATALRFLFP